MRLFSTDRSMIVVEHNRDSQLQIRRFLRKGGALDVGERYP